MTKALDKSQTMGDWLRLCTMPTRTGVAWGVTSRNGRSQLKSLLNPTPIPTGLESTHRCDLGTRVLRGLEVWTEQFRKYRSGLANFSTLTRSPLPL